MFFGRTIRNQSCNGRTTMNPLADPYFWFGAELAGLSGLAVIFYLFRRLRLEQQVSATLVEELPEAET